MNNLFSSIVQLLYGVLFWALIPWIVAVVRKTPITKKGYRILCIIFAVLPCGQIYEALRVELSTLAANFIPLVFGFGMYFLIFYVGTAILKKRHMLAGET